MAGDRTLIFFLHHHNDLDHTVPIIDALGEHTDISIEVILDNITTIGHLETVTDADYRLDHIASIDTVSIHSIAGLLGESEPSQATFKRSTLDKLQDASVLKRIDSILPTDAPKRLFKSTVEESTKDRDDKLLDALCDETDNVVVAGDWTVAKNPSTYILECAQERGYTTVVLPHGDSPYWNDIKKQSYFNQILDDAEIYTDPSAWFAGAYASYERMAGNDWYLMPNEKTAKRLKPFVPDEQVKVLGSPRFNPQWLDVLSDIRPEYTPDVPDGLNVVVFGRNSRYFISEQEVKNTLRLLTGFPDCNVVFKEHPREGLLIDEDSDLSEAPNLTVIQDQVASAALLGWGHVFLEMGTSIVFEAVMREKPVLSLDYTHANYTTVSRYFPEADVRSKDGLYNSIHSFFSDRQGEFYESDEREAFIKELVTSGEMDVLDRYTSFFISVFD